MTRLAFGLAAIGAAVVASPAVAQNCYYDGFGRIFCVPAQYQQQPQYPAYPRNGSPYARDAGPIIDNSGGCKGGSCVNFGPGYR
jgi:hypothetical protein